uniref:Uncharacterized protein n=1 Tax=Pyrodinium bahamense TaxID=73915 RepID=A0A7S0BCE2_9DINO
MANAVLRSAGDLLAVDVLELELDLQHVDVPRYLVNKRLKLKFRMNGVTYLKSKARKAVTDGDHCRVNLDIAGGVVFEGGTSLDFELCRVRFWGPSKTLASCKVPLDLALQSINVGSNQARVWNLTLWAAGAPDKALGRLTAEVCVRTMRLHAAGGIAALRALAVPRPPTHLGVNSMIGLIAFERACTTFAEQAAEAQCRLREAMDEALGDAAPTEGWGSVKEPPDAADEVRVDPPEAPTDKRCERAAAP